MKWKRGSIFFWNVKAQGFTKWNYSHQVFKTNILNVSHDYYYYYCCYFFVFISAYFKPAFLFHIAVKGQPLIAFWRQNLLMPLHWIWWKCCSFTETKWQKKAYPLSDWLLSEHWNVWHKHLFTAVDASLQ